MNSLSRFAVLTAAFSAALSAVFICTHSAGAFAQTTTPQTARETVQGYPAKCGLYIFDGRPAIKVNLYETAEDAAKSATSLVRPKLDVFLDGGPGYEVAKLYKNSKVRAICEKIQGLLKTGQSVEMSINANGVLESMTVVNAGATETLKSDAFVLKSQEEKDLITDLIRAYLAKDEELQNAKQANPAPKTGETKSN